MRTRILGATGLSVSELGLGTFGLSGDGYGPVTAEDADRAVGRARELGVTLFETSDHYGSGVGSSDSASSEPFESRLGRLLGPNEPVIYVTKCGQDMAASPPKKRFDRAFLHRSAARSAERLKRAPDVYLLHHPSLATLESGEAIAALGELVREGVIKHWGISCSEAYLGRRAIELGAKVVELPYNLFQGRDLHDILRDVREHNVGILARSPLAYGLLCGTWSTDKTFEDGDHRRARWTAFELIERLRHVAALRPLVHDEVHTLRAAALRFVLSNDRVSSMILGPKNAAQLESNVRAVGNGPPYLSEQDLAQIPELLASVGCVL